MALTAELPGGVKLRNFNYSGNFGLVIKKLGTEAS